PRHLPLPLRLPRLRNGRDGDRGMKKAGDELAPLTGSERKLALRLAGEHPTLAPVLAGRGRAVLVHESGAGRGGPARARHAVVAVYDYDAGRSFVASVDLRKQKVADAHEVPVQFQL